MRKKQHQEEHIDETWLLPYSDMLTLLLALFIVMFAMSKIDTEKFKRLSQEFNVIFKGGPGILKDSGGNSVIDIHVNTSSSSTKTKIIVEQDKMIEIRNKLEQEIKAGGYADRMKVDISDEGLNISIQDSVIFNSGDADILNNFNPLLIKISKMIKNLDNDIRISGHTDNVPIQNTKFRSNWDLSYMRAANVMNFMVDVDSHLNPKKFSILALGEYKPKYNNSTETGRAKNRSVDILIVRKYH